MTYKILAAIEAQLVDAYVLNRAVELAQQQGTDTQILLLHVLSPQEEQGQLQALDNAADALGWATYRAAWEDIEERFSHPSKSRLESLRESIASQGIPTEYVLTPGVPAEVICQTACDWGANVIVIGYSSFSGISKLPPQGAISRYVKSYAPCLVELVKVPVRSTSSSS